MLPKAELAAAGFSGLLAGSFSFASFVDSRTLWIIAKKGDGEALRKFFPVWWPAGRDWMLPLVLVTSSLHGFAYYSTKKASWLYTALATFLIAPYTGLILGEDIKSLMNENCEGACEIAKSFVIRHQPRFVVAGVAFVAALLAL
mmetsp:Transcript_30066/g.64938  ORF Transcript_30066/g.64938 Transcript_30066/m.64938 type:complete len:144 (-) Transcript_30066:532-963(-)